MASRDELVQALNEHLSIDAFHDGQENGLQIEGRDTIDKVATAVSVNQATIDAANEWGADALLTHHGLLWHNQPNHVRGIRRQRLATILAADLNVITYHLPLDAHPELGNNKALADAAGCTDSTPAFAHKGNPLGIIGALDAPVSFQDWVAGFEQTLRRDCTVDTGPFHVWAEGPPQVQRIGFISGAAPYQVQDAIDLGLDVYVTGEVTEPAHSLAVEAGIHFVAGGHYLTERLGVQRLGDWAAQRFGLEHRFFDVDTLA